MNIFLELKAAINRLWIFGASDILEYDNFIELNNIGNVKNPEFMIIDISKEHKKNVIGIEQQLKAHYLGYVTD